MPSSQDYARIVAIDHVDPHTILGAHEERDGVVVRVHRPDARAVRIVPEDRAIAAAEAKRVFGDGLFEAVFPGRDRVFPYTVDVDYGDGRRFVQHDAYARTPTLGDVDVHLAAEGKHRRLWERFGAHVVEQDGISGTSFVVWAPQARRVSVVGDFNSWDGRLHPMRRLAANGIWELFIPDVGEGATYKFEIVAADGTRFLKTDPFAFRTELRPGTAGIVHRLDRYRFRDESWLKSRAERDPHRAPWSVYEVHLGGFRRIPGERGHGAIERDGGHTGRWLSYREITPYLVEHCKRMGFTHVELMPITEYPFDGSWGYQVTGYYAPTSRYGDPDDLRFLVDSLHAAGIGVILDWVPAHFPRDAHGLRRFDGTAAYEHLDPRQGEHADWGTMVFNYGRAEVRNFLLASALFWLREYHFDGLRVDAVASMLYLDYSRKNGEWVPNRYGGRENLEAIAFLKELNELVRAEEPGAVVIAEESTAWPGVTRPVHLGGLGFAFKWNMGWMHDTLAYFQMDPVFRRHHHNKITFGLWYAWSEHFMLPLSHDEVVHMKGSLYGKMPGDRWQKLANLRALFGWMWAHPGKQLVFMGGEFGQVREFSEERSLDWHLLDDAGHGGVAQFVATLNRLYKERPALWCADGDPAGFRWIDANDVEQSVASIMRFATPTPESGTSPSVDELQAKAPFVIAILNATPVVRHSYRLGVPRKGVYRVVLNSDASEFGGSGVRVDDRPTEDVPSHGHPQSIVLTLPPLSIVWFDGPEARTEEAAKESP